MGLERKRRADEQLQAIRKYFPELGARVNAISEKLQIEGSVPPLAEMWELLWKMQEYFVTTLDETFATIDHEPTLENSYQLEEGDNVTFNRIESPIKKLRINATGGTPGIQEWPIIDRADWVREWEDFLSGGTDYSQQPFQPITPPDATTAQFTRLMYVEDFVAGSSTDVDAVDSMLWHNIGARNGVVKIADATASFSYLERDNSGGGILLSGGDASDDTIEYQSAQDPTVSVNPHLQFLVMIGLNVLQANAALGGQWIWRIGLTGDAILSGDPPNDGIYVQKDAGDNTWYCVCRSGGVETKTSMIGHWKQGIQSVNIRNHRPGTNRIGFNISGAGEAPFNLTETVITSNVPTGGMNVFIQVIPKDALVNSALQVRNYSVDQSLAQSGTFPPGWAYAGIGKMGFSAAFRDDRGFYGNYGYVVYDRGLDDPDVPINNHPGIIQLAAGNNQDTFLANDAGDPYYAATLFYPFHTTSAFSVEMGNEYSPWVGTWLKRFIVHPGLDNTGPHVKNIMVGLATQQNVPPPYLFDGGPAVFAFVAFYVSLSQTGDTNWHIYNDMTGGADDDIDTGVQAYDPTSTDDTPWVFCDIEKNEGEDLLTFTLRSETGVTLFQTTSAFDSGTYGDFPMGPFVACDGGVGGGFNGMLVDAYGYKHDGIGRVA